MADQIHGAAKQKCILRQEQQKYRDLLRGAAVGEEAEIIAEAAQTQYQLVWQPLQSKIIQFEQDEVQMSVSCLLVLL